jgi:hypothetical protein
VIDEAISVENLATQVGKDITKDLDGVIANVKGEVMEIAFPEQRRSTLANLRTV